MVLAHPADTERGLAVRVDHERGFDGLASVRIDCVVGKRRPGSGRAHDDGNIADRRAPVAASG